MYMYIYLQHCNTVLDSPSGRLLVCLTTTLYDHPSRTVSLLDKILVSINIFPGAVGAS